jgi:hypothetical protein
MLSATSIGERLETRCAVVLERIARGGGATKWYECADESRLPALISRFSPGSVVSFYFDGRIQSDVYSDVLRQSLELSLNIASS